VPTLVPDWDMDSCFAPTFTVTHEHLRMYAWLPSDVQVDTSTTAARHGPLEITPCTSLHACPAPDPRVTNASPSPPRNGLSKLRPARFGARRRPFPTPLLQPHSTHGASESYRSFTATRPPPTAAVAGGRLIPRTRTCRIADVQRPRRVRFAGWFAAGVYESAWHAEPG